MNTDTTLLHEHVDRVARTKALRWVGSNARLLAPAYSVAVMAGAVTVQGGPGALTDIVEILAAEPDPEPNADYLHWDAVSHGVHVRIVEERRVRS